MTKRRNDIPLEDTLGHDPVVGDALRHLDPGLVDGGYWHRFHRHVMTGASRELARRRMMADMTMSDIIASWSRTLVPTALMAAAVAAFTLLWTPPEPPLGPLAIEEVLRQGAEGVAPAALEDELPSEARSFLLASREY